MSGNQIAAQAVDAKAAIDTSVFTLPDDEADADAARPPLEPPVLKTLKPADLPPSNPLVGSFPRTSEAFRVPA